MADQTDELENAESPSKRQTQKKEEEKLTISEEMRREVFEGESPGLLEDDESATLRSEQRKKGLQ